VAWAREIIAAFDRPENRGRGAIGLNGRMVERLHLEQASKTIALAEAAARTD
jgi:citrate lyase subunit beta/citryl-CoA lyase